MPKVIDTFTFYNEENILLLRLMELYDTVDYFVLVEATHTFVGNPKPLIFNKLKYTNSFKKYTDKIVHVIVDDMLNYDYHWRREVYQRNCIKRGLEQLKLSKNDIVFVSDVDEIFDKEIVLKIKSNPFFFTEHLHLSMDLYYYNINSFVSSNWTRPYCIKYGDIKDTINMYRISDTQILQDVKAGWHLSFFGDVDFIYNKLSNYSHQEEHNTSSINNKENIKKCLESGIDLIGCDNITYVPIEDNNYIPHKWKEYQELINDKLEEDESTVTIFYGTENNYIDVTHLLLHENQDYIFISKNDYIRSMHLMNNYSDVVKHIYLKDSDGNIKLYDPYTFVFIKKDTTGKYLNINNITDIDTIWNYVKSRYSLVAQKVFFKLQLLHEKVKLIHDEFITDFQMQILIVSYIKNDNCVLEIGAKNGVKSLIVSSLLNDSNNHVVMEFSEQNVEKLRENKNINNKHFHIEQSVICRRLLMQKNDMIRPYDVNMYITGDWKILDNISYESLCVKYNLKFDTLILSCKDVVYYILMDDPLILNHIKTIIIENDVTDIEYKKYINKLFRQNGFRNILDNRISIYEVWSK